MNYNIIASGSDGNCTVLNDILVIDMGISFKKLEPYYRNLEIVLLTHIHSDHFKKATIKKLAAARPFLRFGCPAWLYDEVLDCEVNQNQIDEYMMNCAYCYKNYTIIPFKLSHNVSNCGYKIHFSDGNKVIYATDTNSISTEAKNYDLYLIEANFEEEEIRQRISAKQLTGEFIYEYNVLNNHLSLKKCNDFLYSNMGRDSTYVYMHQHS